MTLTRDKREDKKLLQKLNEFNQNIQSNMEDVEQMRIFSNNVRSGKSERPISSDELNAIIAGNGNYKYEFRRFK